MIFTVLKEVWMLGCIILKILKKENIKIYKQEYLHPKYNHKIFVPNLSILDLLFYNFNSALDIIRAEEIGKI